MRQFHCKPDQSDERHFVFETFNLFNNNENDTKNLDFFVREAKTIIQK